MENHRFKKKYGQNFLRDESILNRIIDESNILEDSLVIEIGPGDGALTNKLINRSKQVLAYEKVLYHICRPGSLGFMYKSGVGAVLCA